MSNFGMITWLRGKGVSITKKEPVTGLGGLHFYIAGRFSGPRPLESKDLSNTTDSSLVSELMLDESAYRDECSCICSPQGCTPLSKLPILAFVRDNTYLAQTLTPTW